MPSLSPCCSRKCSGERSGLSIRVRFRFKFRVTVTVRFRGMVKFMVRVRIRVRLPFTFDRALDHLDSLVQLIQFFRDVLSRFFGT